MFKLVPGHNDFVRGLNRRQYANYHRYCRVLSKAIRSNIERRSNVINKMFSDVMIFGSGSMVVDE